jgi:hypothetical protein
METFLKKRIEIVIETPLIDRVTDCLDRMEVTGYSALALIAGRGEGGSWSADGQVGTALQMTLIVCIVDPILAEQVIRQMFEIVKLQAGLIAVSDVHVLRPGRF